MIVAVTETADPKRAVIYANLKNLRNIKYELEELAEIANMLGATIENPAFNTKINEAIEAISVAREMLETAYQKEAQND